MPTFQRSPVFRMLLSENYLISVHLLGALTGIILYLMLGVMAWRQYIAATRTAGALSVHRTRRGVSLLLVATIGVVLSVTANVLHLRTQAAPAPLLSYVLMVAYALLTGLLVRHLWHSTVVQRVLLVTAIAVFLWSAWHLIQHQTHADSLIVELVIHYAPLPLVAALLYDEYRFVFADIFLKRALALILLVVTAATLYAMGVLYASPALILVLWIATALLYPGFRAGINALVDRYLLRRVSARDVRARAASGFAGADTSDAVFGLRMYDTASTVGGAFGGMAADFLAQ